MIRNAQNFERQVDAQLKALLDPQRLFEGWANRELMDIYGRAQLKRWQTEGASERDKWKPLNAEYAKRKRKRFRDYPGKGTKMLVATGRLLASILPEEQRGIAGGAAAKGDFRKLIERRRVTLATTVEYAPWVDEVRSFTKFGAEFGKSVAESFRKYLMRSVKGARR